MREGNGIQYHVKGCNACKLAKNGNSANMFDEVKNELLRFEIGGDTIKLLKKSEGASAVNKTLTQEKTLCREKSEFYLYRKHITLTLMFLPVVIYYIVFHYVPMYGAIIAFKDYSFTKGIMGSEWVGLDNFRRMFNSPSFLEVFRNTFIISFYKLITGFPAPILFAILLNELTSTKFKKSVQTISYLPHFLSWVVLGGMFTQLLSLGGPLMQFLETLE